MFFYLLIRVSAHGGKDAEALALEIFELRAGISLIVVPIGAGPVGVEQDLRRPNQAAYLIKPALSIPLESFVGDGGQPYMAQVWEPKYQPVSFSF